jgi:uncharacterized protein
MNPHGKFSWYELMTPDPAAAKAFYTSVVGWTSSEVGSPDKPYGIFNVRGSGIAGILTITPEMGAMPPSWMGYVAVDNCDEHVEAIVNAGGSLRMPPTDVPGMLRFAVVTDPQGAPFYVFNPFPGMTPPADPPVPPEPGTIGWHELMAVDGDSAFEFYSSMFGWTKSQTHDMGPMGIYQLFAIDGKEAGGMLTKPPSVPAPSWSYYIMVDSCKAAIEKITAAGGTIIHGPHAVPGGSWIVQAIDPQGALFCLNSVIE